MMKYFKMEKFFRKVDFNMPKKVPKGAKKLKLNAGEEIERFTDSEECERTKKHGFAPGPKDWSEEPSSENTCTWFSTSNGDPKEGAESTECVIRCKLSRAADVLSYEGKADDAQVMFRT